jgi:outer membrane lipoprotein-sorting protein
LVRLTRLQRKVHFFGLAVSAILILFSAIGCAASHTTVVKPSEAPAPAKTAAKQDLVASFNQQASAVTSINASVTMTLTAGSAYTGVIKQYHEINGFILAQKPASVRVIGQVPVAGTNIFDMVSDGEMFHIFIPSQHKFIVGPANLQRQSAKPIENLRPQHLTNAIFWEPLPANAPILIEEAAEGASRYYVLTVVRARDSQGTTAPDSSPDWEISERIWFDRSDLSVARLQTYEAGGAIGSDISYAGWAPAGAGNYPRQITLSRPDNDYKLQIGIKKVTLNETITPDRFVLNQPPGTELVNAEEQAPPATPEKKP